MSLKSRDMSSFRLFHLSSRVLASPENRLVVGAGVVEALRFCKHSPRQLSSVDTHMSFGCRLVRLCGSIARSVHQQLTHLVAVGALGGVGLHSLVILVLLVLLVLLLSIWPDEVSVLQAKLLQFLQHVLIRGGWHLTGMKPYLAGAKMFWVLLQGAQAYLHHVLHDGGVAGANGPSDPHDQACLLDQETEACHVIELPISSNVVIFGLVSVLGRHGKRTGSCQAGSETWQW